MHVYRKPCQTLFDYGKMQNIRAFARDQRVARRADDENLAHFVAETVVLG
jgi:hypothetical protein